MTDNIVRLPRPKVLRPETEPLGLYLRVGRNQHHDLLDVLSSGERSFHGLVVEAGNVERHSDLISHALEAGLDVTLDPKTHAMALPGGYSASMAALPWGLGQHHTLNDFAGDVGRRAAIQVSEFAQENRFTQILGPTHLLSGANDPWLRHDIRNVIHLKNDLRGTSSNNIELIYPLAMPMQVLRDRAERLAVIDAIADAPVNAIWLILPKGGEFRIGCHGRKNSRLHRGGERFSCLGHPCHCRSCWRIARSWFGSCRKCGWFVAWHNST